MQKVREVICQPLRQRVASVAVVALFLASAARAGEGEGPTESGAGIEHHHEFVTFLGVTDVDDDLRPTLGFDYERRLTPRVGVGVVADWVFGGDGREFILAPAAFFRPVPVVRLTLAAGLQRDREEREVEGVFRVGAEYLIELDERWSVAPSVNVDFVTGETISVFGVAVGYAF